MDHIEIEGIPPYDGRYPFELGDGAFTVREWGWIKRHSGYLPLTVWDGLLASDPELLAVFGLIALVRAEKVHRRDVPDLWERFADAPAGARIRLDLSAPEGDADPPSSESSNGNESISGTDTSPSSESLTEILADSGTPVSATSASLPVS